MAVSTEVTHTEYLVVEQFGGAVWWSSLTSTSAANSSNQHQRRQQARARARQARAVQPTVGLHLRLQTNIPSPSRQPPLRKQTIRTCCSIINSIIITTSTADLLPSAATHPPPPISSILVLAA